MVGAGRGADEDLCSDRALPLLLSGVPVTDAFLDDHKTQLLAGDLSVIAASAPELLRIARRETSPPGGRAARNPNVPGSRPPVNLGALSVSHEMHACLASWCTNLRDDTGIPMPTLLDDRGLAMHLRYHVHRVAQQAWASDCAAEISRWATVVQTVTTPPPVRHLEDYTPAQRQEGMSIAKVDAVMCAALVAEWTDGRYEPKPDQIRTWGKRGHITVFGPAGRRIYSPREVIAHMKRRDTLKAQ